MPLMLHAGAEPIEYEALAMLPTPEPTATHHPISHVRIVDIVKNMLNFYGHEVTEEHYGVTKNGARFFGVMTLKSTYGSYGDMVGLRSSVDKSISCAVGCGSRVWVCDNLAFSADHMLRRKSTAGIKHELPGLISELIEPLAAQRAKQHQQFLAYQKADITDKDARAAIGLMYEEGVINLQRIPKVLKQWHNPTYDWGQKSVWRLFNACTISIAGGVIEDPSATTKLHRICDEMIGEIFEAAPNPP